MSHEARDPKTIDRLFEAAAELPLAERATWLAQHCADPGVRRDVEELLRHLESPTPGLEGELRLPSSQVASGTAPERIGDYCVLEVLGAGGMGVVYLAEHPNTRRRVAVKVLHTGLASDEYARRFRLEVELLGRIQDSGIAQIYDAGTTGEGVAAKAYLVMEYVAGRSLTRYAQEEDLSIEARVRLLAQVAQAAHAAHLHGVIHRDLKPANVLVTDAGEVKVIDFGVARTVELDGDDSLRTRTGAVVGTLAYMSPEQVRGDANRIDVRTDVYSLGVMAYELLGRKLPLDLAGLTLTEAGRRVTQVDPPRLSTLDLRCRGDLEWIVAMALEKEADRRYQSARALVDDLERHLRSEPVVAGPASVAYVLRKIARRHRVAFAGIAATLVAILIGAGVALRYAVVNKRLAEQEGNLRTVAEERAEELARRSDELREVVRFQDQMIGGFNPRAAGDQLMDLIRSDVLEALDHAGLDDATLAREVAALDGVLERLDGALLAVSYLDASVLQPSRILADERFTDQPVVRAQLLSSIGRVRHNLGIPGGEEQLRVAYALLMESVGPDHDRTLHVGWLLAIQTQDLNEQEELIQNLLEGMETHLELEYLRGTALCLLASIIQRRDGYEAEVKYYEETLASGALDDPRFEIDRLTMQKHLGKMYAVFGRFEEAEAMQRETADELLAIVGEEHKLTASALEGLGTTLGAMGRCEEAIPVFERALESARRFWGDSHSSTLLIYSNLASAHMQLGHWEEAVPFLREAVADGVVGVHPNSRVQRLSNLASTLTKLDRLNEAEPHAIESYELGRANSYPDMQDLVENLQTLAEKFLARADLNQDAESAASAEALFLLLDGDE